MTKEVDNIEKEEVEAQAEETITPEVEPEVVVTPEPTEVEELQNRIATLENSFKNYCDEVEKRFNSLNGSLKNSSREDQRKNALAYVPSITKSEVKTKEDFVNKYFNK